MSWFRRHEWQADYGRLGYRTGTIRCRHCGQKWDGKLRRLDWWPWGCRRG